MKYTFKLVLYLLSFLTGFSFMGYEILGSRILAPYFGGSVYVWGSIISVFMLGLSLGYALGGKMADIRTKFLDLFYIFIFAAIYLFLTSIYGKYICVYVLSINFNVKYLTLLVSLLLFLIPGTLWGMILPYTIRMLKSSKKNVGVSVGSMYSISTIGGILGVLFVSFYILEYIGTANAVRLMCIPLFLCSIIVIINNLYIEQ